MVAAAIAPPTPSRREPRETAARDGRAHEGRGGAWQSERRVLS